MAERLSRHRDIEYAEPDERRYPVLIPDDPEFVKQTYLSDPVIGINTVPAWDITTGSAATVIAVVDTGILPDHIDLGGRTLPGYDFISGVASDPNGEFFAANDGDGRDPNPFDPGDHVEAEQCGLGEPALGSSWHGTRVASLIGAAFDTNGMAGVDSQGMILPARAVGRCGGFASDISDAIRWAAGLPVPGVPTNPNPAKVINVSLGAVGPCLQTEQAAIDAALATGAIVVVAAGNSANNALRFAPANCHGVLTVAGTNLDGGLAGFSDYGIKVSLSAPGVDILSAANQGTQAPLPSPGGDDHNTRSGTSFSAPLVSGVAALMLSLNASLTPKDITGTLRATAHAFPAAGVQPCNNPLCGTGIADAKNAVEAVANGNVVSAPDNGNGVQEALTNALSTQPNMTVGASLDASFELDIYQIVLTADGTLSASTSGTTDTYGYLFDATGKLLAQADDIAFPSDLNFSFSQALNAGTYFVGVEGFNRNVLGDYTFKTTLVTSASTAGGGAGGVGAAESGGGGGGATDHITAALILFAIGLVGLTRRGQRTRRLYRAA